MQRRCPDCGVTMETVQLQSNGGYHVDRAATGEKREGLLGRFGVEETADVAHVACPECGLLRAYLDVE
ncbi:hypothetical protein [Halorubrum gandharaense]